MMTSGSVPINEATREFLLAPDLGEWVNRRNLVMLVLDVVQKVDDSRLRTAGGTAGGRRCQPRALLTLVTYCYAAGIYGSNRITRQIETESTLRYLCANHRPDGALLCHFRRQNREVIEQCLAKVCFVAWKTKFGSWRRKRLDPEHNPKWGSGFRIDPVFQTQIMFEVRERVNRAERQDNDRFGFQPSNYFTADV